MLYWQVVGLTMQRVAFINNCDDAFGQSLVNMFLNMGWFVVAALSRLDERKHFIIRDNLRFADSILIIEVDPKKPEYLEKIKPLISAHVDRLDCLIHIVPPFSFDDSANSLENLDNYVAYMTQRFTKYVSSALRPLLEIQNGLIIHISFGQIWSLALNRQLDHAASVALRKTLLLQNLELIDSGLRSTLLQSSPARWEAFATMQSVKHSLDQSLKLQALFARLRKNFILKKIKRLATRQIDRSYLTATNSLFLATIFSGYLVDYLLFRFHTLRIRFKALQAGVPKTLR